MSQSSDRLPGAVYQKERSHSKDLSKRIYYPSVPVLRLKNIITEEDTKGESCKQNRRTMQAKQEKTASKTGEHCKQNTGPGLR